MFRAAVLLALGVVFLAGCCGQCPYACERQRVDMIESNLLNWNRQLMPWQEKTGTWQVAGVAKLDADSPGELAAEPGEGVLLVATGKAENLISKAEFGDVRVHVEFMVPEGSNSGIYFAGRYEVQVFDSWGKEDFSYSDCGGIYQRWDTKTETGFEGHAPLENASKRPGQWQSFDIVFRAPRFDEAGKKIANAVFEKVYHNGVLVHKDVELNGPTRSPVYWDESPTGPIKIQGDHGPVAYRNFWIERLN